MAYNFVLIMTNTGMRPSEAKNLQCRDIQGATDSEGRKFVSLYVRGKAKHRTLVAASNVADYLERVRELSNATETTDHVFTTIEGQPARTLYHSLMESLLTESGLLMSSGGSRRSTYSFRHTYATFRLSEGVDVYFLAKQMGTSVKMIENHYGHITPVKHAERILKGLPGWGHIPVAPRIAGRRQLGHIQWRQSTRICPSSLTPQMSVSGSQNRRCSPCDLPTREDLPLRVWYQLSPVLRKTHRMRCC